MKKFIIPLVLFAAIGALLWVGLSLDPRKIPSPLVGKPLPAFKLATVADAKRVVTPEDLRGRTYLLNVWASWCTSCRQEHSLLSELAKSGVVPIVGLNYKDKRDDAVAYLAKLGNPYELILSDPDGRTGIELGVYGTPETFVIDKAGIIRHKHVGPITPEVWRNLIEPKLREAAAST
jgi:cytochrome c biogenesis protein CcmG/thiol:disulfide interchange protein DsbE